MKKHFLFVIAGFFLIFRPALAGDIAEIDILGFSKDGSVFVFEEYGRQDGSGFVYANRFFIDTATDNFLSGTPIRVTLEDETSTIQAARAEAAEKSAELMERYEVRTDHARLLAFNPPSELADPSRLRFFALPIVPPAEPPAELVLEEFVPDSEANCYDFGPRKAFRLKLFSGPENFGEGVVYEDSSVPASRRCALSYRIAGVAAFDEAMQISRMVVLVIVESVGFEGPDLRWIAVSLKPV